MHCKALERKGSVSLGIVREELVWVAAERGYVYLLGYTHRLARVRFLRVSRAGGEQETLVEQKGLGEPSELVLRDGAAYYTQGGSLFRLGPEPSASVTLHRAADSPVAVDGDRAFFVDCDRPGKSDHLVEQPLSGGEARTLAELPHTPGTRCSYSSVVADAREVLIADWNGHLVHAVSRADGAVRELVKQRGFVEDLMLETDTVSFLSKRGLERMDRTGANSRILLASESVRAPYSRAKLHGGEYWLHDDIAYTTVTHLFRLPYQGGTPQAMATYKVAEPTLDTPGDEQLVSFGVDDECAYFTRKRHGQPLELLARAR
ncbi:MAG TPA: hypothetical protein VGK73_20750 [Polyangiaceae bacterium]